MGFFKKVAKTFKQGWKDTLGWADDKETIGIAAPLALGALTGGLGAAALGATGWGIAGGAIAGGLSGTLKGVGDVKAMHAQEKAMNAQLAAAQKIADAQNPANLVTAVTPTAGGENAMISEENMANEARRRYSFNKTLYKSRSRLGASGGNATRTTLG